MWRARKENNEKQVGRKVWKQLCNIYLDSMWVPFSLYSVNYWKDRRRQDSKYDFMVPRWDNITLISSVTYLDITRRLNKQFTIRLDNCLRSIPGDPDVVCLFVPCNIETSDQVTKWPSDRVTECPSDRVTKQPSDQVTKWQEASQTIDCMVYFQFSYILCNSFTLQNQDVLTVTEKL